MRNDLLLSKLFSFAFDRHIANCHNADYEAWFVEKWLWYGGVAGC